MILIAERAVNAHDKYIELNILLLKILLLVYQNLSQRKGDPPDRPYARYTPSFVL